MGTVVPGMKKDRREEKKLPRRAWTIPDETGREVREIRYKRQIEGWFALPPSFREPQMVRGEESRTIFNFYFHPFASQG